MGRPSSKLPPTARERPPLLREHAYTVLKDLLTSGTYAPGTFLSERKLVADLGMSKTPIRNALERLAAEGFLTIAPQQGIHVRQLPLDELLDSQELRLALETFTARRAAERMTASRLEALERNLARQEAAAASRDAGAYLALDIEFHLLISEAAANKEILRLIAQQRDRVGRVVREIARRDPDRLRTSHAEHVKIYEALRKRDPDRAAARMEAHLESGRRFLLSR